MNNKTQITTRKAKKLKKERLPAAAVSQNAGFWRTCKAGFGAAFSCACMVERVQKSDSFYAALHCIGAISIVFSFYTN